MTDASVVELDAVERDRLLGTGGTGVISFATDEGSPPYTVPISYGYNDAESTFFFRLATWPEGVDGEVDDRPITFVMQRETEDGWRSVIAKGTLERTTDDAIATKSLEELQRVRIPYVDIFERPVREVTFEFFRLDPEELTARREVPRDE